MDTIFAFGSAHLWLLSVFFLTMTSTLCFVGLMSPTYKENLLQNLGMCVLMIFCASRAKDIWLLEVVSVDWFGVHLGMVLFAFGQFIKVLQALRRRRLRQEVVDSIGLDAMLEISRWRQSMAHARDTGGQR